MRLRSASAISNQKEMNRRWKSTSLIVVLSGRLVPVADAERGLATILCGYISSIADERQQPTMTVIDRLSR